MEQSFNSILYKELCQKQHDLTECGFFWESNSDNPQDLYQHILQQIGNLTFLQYLEKLSEQESKLLYLLIQQEGTATSIQILQKKILSESEIQTASKSLQQKFIIFIRKCISQVKIVPYSHTIFSELYNRFQTTPLVTIDDIISKKTTIIPTILKL